jgi:hypothetical protein
MSTREIEVLLREVASAYRASLGWTGPDEKPDYETKQNLLLKKICCAAEKMAITDVLSTAKELQDIENEIEKRQEIDGQVNPYIEELEEAINAGRLRAHLSRLHDEIEAASDAKQQERAKLIEAGRLLNMDDDYYNIENGEFESETHEKEFDLEKFLFTNFRLITAALLHKEDANFDEYFLEGGDEDED